MSQYPPPGGPPMYPPNIPPNVPPGGPGGPGFPGGFGPPGYSLPSQSRTSGPAIASLICGLLSFCIPGIGTLAAVILGIVGISQSSNPAVKGRGMAIAGLILGILGGAAWGAAGVGIYGLFQRAGPERVFAQQYVTDLTAGKVDQCVQNSTGNIVPEQLKADYNQSQAWGALTTNIAFPQNFNYDNGTTTITFQGVCSFARGQKKYMISIVKDSSGHRVDSFQWMP